MPIEPIPTINDLLAVNIDGEIFNNMGIMLPVEKIHLLTQMLFTASWTISSYRYFTK